MADDYEYDMDIDDGVDYDDDWMYVEDEFLLADELAETQIPDPGYAGTNGDIELDSYEYDLYGFWDDQEYGYDHYWDYDTRSRMNTLGKVGTKRKRTSERAPLASGKRRKTSAVHSKSAEEHQGADTVKYMSSQERLRRAQKLPAMLKQGRGHAFLADWRIRYADEHVTPVKKMPAAMKRAAEAQEHDTFSEPVHFDEDPNEELKVEDEDVMPDMDSDALKSILKQRLEEAGLDGIDEGVFMQTITKMLAGDGGDDVTSDLASALLSQVTAGNGGAALSGWLSGQGVPLDNDNNDASSVATEELPEKPLDMLTSKHEVLRGSRNATLADSPKEGTKVPQKRSTKRVKFDVASSIEPSQEVPTKSSTEAVTDSSTLELRTELTSKITPDEDASSSSAANAISTGNGQPKKTRAQKSIPVESASSTATKSRKRKASSADSGVVADDRTGPAAKRTRAAKANTRR